MAYKELIDKILQASEGVLEEAEVYLTSNERLSIQSFQGEISKYEIAGSGGLSLRGIYQGRMGYAYTEKLDPSEADRLVEEVKDNSLYLEGDPEIIYEGSDSYEEFERSNLDREEMSIEDKIDLVLKLEEAVLKEDDRIYEAVVAYQETSSKLYIGNSKGVDLKEEGSSAMVYASSYAREGDETKTGGAYRYIFDFDSLRNYQEIAEECARDAVSKLSARPVKSKDYPVVLKNESFADLLMAFSSIFSAESVQKDLSLLKDRIGEKLAAEKLTIVDNPFLKEGYGSGVFDSEGTATQLTEIIKDGVLKGYLYNWKAAAKDGVESTGNASRSYKGSMSISPSNLYVEKGDRSFDELLSQMGDGLIIDSLQGLHSGLNAVSGDFSLASSGYMVEGGKISYPVNQITVAGNFFDLIKDIEEIADDLKFTLSSGGRIGSPSILIEKLAISGE